MLGEDGREEGGVLVALALLVINVCGSREMGAKHGEDKDRG